MRTTRLDAGAAAALWLANLLVFGAGASRLGFYYDDSRWMLALGSVDLAGLWKVITEYIPGRPLFIVWEYLFLHTAADPGSQLARLHVAQSALDGLVAVSFFFLLRMLRLAPHAALAAAGLFSFWPIHGETHFFNTAVAGNLVSTLFAILFATTSVAVLRHSATRWIRIADVVFFLCALLTYDQTFFVVAGLVALRLWRSRRLPQHLPHLAGIAVQLWWKLGGGAGGGPQMRPDALAANILPTISWTLGGRGLAYVRPLFDKTNATDWLLAAAAAVVLTAAALWLYRAAPASEAPSASPSLRQIFGLAVFFWTAAYLPAWLWYLHPRLHYLPSVALSLGVAAVVARVLRGVRSRAVHAAILMALGAVTGAFAAAGRGESRWWEEAFAMKKQLFDELRPDLRGKEILVLENFPTTWGPAYLIYPHDAENAAALFYGASTLDPRFTGDIGATPAPRGLFLRTFTYFHGPRSFRYHATGDFLIARFQSVDGGRLRFEKNPRLTLPYRILSTRVAAQAGPFQVVSFAARRRDDETVLSLTVRATLEPGAHLVAAPGFEHHGQFHPWSYHAEEHTTGLAPILLSESSGGSFEWEATVPLRGFPDSERIELEFYAAFRDRPPVLLGRAEAAVSP